MAIEFGRHERAVTIDRSRSGERSHCTPPTPVADLLIGAQRGEFRAWNEIVTRYERLVYAIPLREGLSIDDAEEVSQATFQALVESLHRVRDPERLGHWLATVARRLTWRRRAARSKEVLGDDTEPAVDDETEQWSRTVSIYEAVADLGDPCRTLLFGLFFDPAEPSYDDLGRLLGLATGSVGPLRGRCLARLRAVLETDR